MKVVLWLRLTRFKFFAMQLFDFLTNLWLLSMALVFLFSRFLDREKNFGEVVLYIYIFFLGSFLQVFAYFLFPIYSDPFSLVQKCFFLSISAAAFSLISFIVVGLRSSMRPAKFVTKSEVGNAMINLRSSIFSKIEKVQKNLEGGSEGLASCKKDIYVLNGGLESLRDRLLKTLKIVSSIDDALMTIKTDSGPTKKHKSSSEV